MADGWRNKILDNWRKAKNNGLENKKKNKRLKNNTEADKQRKEKTNV